MQALFLFIIMIFVYPVIFFSSLHLFKSTYDLKYTLFQIWARFMLKRAKAKIECERCDLIPLENDYVFIANHVNSFDTYVLAQALPVRTHFIFDKSARVPYLKVYLKRLKSLFVDYSNVDFKDYLSQLEDDLNESSMTVFNASLKQTPLPLSFYELAKNQKWTLICVTLKNSKNLLRIGKYHTVKAEISVPLYFEEYESLSCEAIQKQINERLIETSKV